MIYGQDSPSTASVIQISPPGDIEKETFGTTRVEIDYNSGSTAGHYSITTVDIHRNSLTVSGFPEGKKSAEVSWKVQTDRTGFSANMSIHYVENEVAAIDEGSIGLYKSENPDGPWVKVDNALIDTQRNQITLETGSFSHFVILSDTTSVGSWELY